MIRVKFSENMYAYTVCLLTACKDLNIQHSPNDDERPVRRGGVESFIEVICRASGQIIIFNFIKVFELFMCAARFGVELILQKHI